MDAALGVLLSFGAALWLVDGISLDLGEFDPNGGADT